MAIACLSMNAIGSEDSLYQYPVKDLLPPDSIRFEISGVAYDYTISTNADSTKYYASGSFKFLLKVKGTPEIRIRKTWPWPRQKPDGPMIWSSYRKIEVENYFGDFDIEYETIRRGVYFEIRALTNVGMHTLARLYSTDYMKEEDKELFTSVILPSQYDREINIYVSNKMLHISNGGDNINRLSIYHISGAKVCSTEFVRGNRPEVISLDSLSNGYYIVMAETFYGIKSFKIKI